MVERGLFNEKYVLLDEMYSDPYFPDFLVDKVRDLIMVLIKKLEDGERDYDKIQEYLDQMTLAINDLEEEFYDNNSEIESLARESISDAILHILSHYAIRIYIEDALRLRNW